MMSLWAVTAHASIDPLQQQRQWFTEARTALDAGDMARFQALRDKLAEYPLAPYLDIWQAWKGLETGEDRNVAGVLARNADIPEAFDLYLAWIESLAERGQWPHVAVRLKKLPAAAGQLPVIAMLAQWYNGHHAAALKQYGHFWRHGHHFSAQARQLAQAWQQAGHPQVDEAWERIGVLAHRGQWDEIGQLAEILPQAQQPLIRRWHEMQQMPKQALQQWRTGVVPAQPAHLMLTDALRRLSLDDAAIAWHLLQQVAADFSPQQLQALQRHIALRGARQHLPAAAGWLAVLAPGQQDARTRAWQVRLDLLQGAWQQALTVIESMPADERDESRWRYWHARCLAATGHAQQAEALLTELAAGRGYHSFLAAESLGLPYQLQDSEPDVNSDRIERVARMAGIRRAHEWWRLQEPGKAGREWHAALANADPETWAAAAGLANLWGWYDRVIYSTYRAEANDALSYRFPLGYEKTVAAAASENGLHASLIWSVIRQESAFNMQAVSRHGARGLMQLMPATAAGLTDGKADLFDPAENIGLGARYLAKLVNRFNGNKAIAVAAYNAGPTRVAGWLDQTPFARADVWIEAIPTAETRRYVQHVMAFMIVYDWRQAKEPISLTARMQFTSGEDQG